MSTNYGAAYLEIYQEFLRNRSFLESPSAACSRQSINGGYMRRPAFLILLLLMLLMRSAVAGLNQWTHIGPEGGQVSAIIVDPTHGGTLYAAVSGAVYKSEDGAASWRRLDLADSAVTLLAIST